MGSGYPDGWQEAFLICQSTINSWQAQDQLSVSKYSLGQSHLKVSALVPPVGRVSCSSVWNLNPQVHKQPWSCRAFLEKISQASKTMRLLHLVRIKAEKQSAKGEVWFGLFSGVLLSSSSSLRWIFLPDIISFSGLAQIFAPDSFVLLTFGSTLHWLCFESCFTHINV